MRTIPLSKSKYVAGLQVAGLQSVAPALVPGLGYDDLDGVADGGAAADTLVRLATGAIGSPDDVRRQRRALLEYCKRDTLAMVDVHQALQRSAAGQGPAAG
jgi:hypothetical protein